MFCKLSLIGRLGRDPETKFTPQGAQLCNFAVAVTEKVKGEKKTDWYTINIWGKLGEMAAQYLKKGNLVYLEGKLDPKEWTDKDGKVRTQLYVTASDFRKLTFDEQGEDSGNYTAKTAYSNKSSSSVNDEAEITEDDIPF